MCVCVCVWVGGWAGARVCACLGCFFMVCSDLKDLLSSVPLYDLNNASY